MPRRRGAFLPDADAGLAFDTLLAELRASGHPQPEPLSTHRRALSANPPQSAEALAQLAALPPGTGQALRDDLHGDDLML